jgi:imidazoleglycerol-phosphate dehydratase
MSSFESTAHTREAVVERKTGETDIFLRLRIDGAGESVVDTGIGFLDHMLTLLARHGHFDLEVKAVGDLQTGGHHTVEDVGIALGLALEQALGDKIGIARYGFTQVPMDEALAAVTLDVSGRPFLVYEGSVGCVTIGGFDTGLTPEFLQAFVNNSRITLHVSLLAGSNPHHMIEAVFKALARALDQATGIDPRVSGVPSTKGIL